MSIRDQVWALSDALVENICAASPITATFAGVPGYDHLWDDVSPAGQEARAQSVAHFSARLAALEASPETKDADTRLAMDVLREYLDERGDFYASADRFLDLNNITSTFQCVPMAFDLMDPGTPEGAEAVVARLHALPAALRGYRALLAEGLARGAVVSARQVDAAVEQGRVQAGEASVFHAVAARCEHPDAPQGADVARDAMRALTEWLATEYRPHANPVDGVGRERYVRAARQHLGMALDVDETYAWGFEEIRRIDAAMQALTAQLAPGLSVAEMARRLDADPAGALALPDAFLAAMRERQETALAQLAGSHFDVPEPIRRLDVKLAPPGGKVGAYYCQPSEDFSRAGAVWYSPGALSAMPVWQEISTAYHEGFPGHHLQVGLQLYNRERLSRFQRVLASWAGSCEGWALYAEQLMLELGYFERPEYALGMYAAQLMRASRVVVDIGMHLGLRIPADFDFHPGEVWSYGLGVEMMRDRSLMADEHAASDVVRYLGWPGQAIAYSVGQRVILDARDALRQRPGFALRRFHQQVLDLGSVGLGTLRERLVGAAA